MEAEKVGALIRALRIEKRMTQRQLAEALCVSDRAVSKWECGHGCPDISLLPRLSTLLEVDPQELLNGALNAQRKVAGNMKRLHFTVCPTCGSLIMMTGGSAVFCCGRRLNELKPEKADEAHMLHAEVLDGEWYVTTGHPMERAHYISFVALLNGDTAVVRKCWPEWDLQLRLPYIKHGRLVWHCTEHGVFYRDL